MKTELELRHLRVFVTVAEVGTHTAAARALGVSQSTVSETLAALGSESVWVVHGSDGLDEMTLSGPTYVAELRNGTVRSHEVTPDDAGLPHHAPEAVRGGSAEDNAQALRALLDGAPGAYRDTVLLNVAAALVIADRVPTLKDGVTLAADAIDSGRARAALDRLIARSNA